jgi:hypothetical protein
LRLAPLVPRGGHARQPCAAAATVVPRKWHTALGPQAFGHALAGRVVAPRDGADRPRRLARAALARVERRPAPAVRAAWRPNHLTARLSGRLVRGEPSLLGWRRASAARRPSAFHLEEKYVGARRADGRARASEVPQPAPAPVRSHRSACADRRALRGRALPYAASMRQPPLGPYRTRVVVAIHSHSSGLGTRMVSSSHAGPGLCTGGAGLHDHHRLYMHRLYMHNSAARPPLCMAIVCCAAPRARK